VQRLLNAATWDADTVRDGCPLGRCGTTSSTISGTRRAESCRSSSTRAPRW
jgi:hypothetical protein